MRCADFEILVRRLAADIPSHFFDGIAEVVVSRRAVPHPTRGETYTLGECIPLPIGDSGTDGVQSRIVLYHGSFRALARLSDDFDWRSEAWETLSHELRHHLEWKAGVPALEAFDRAVEENFARQDGDAFDPSFYLDGESPAPGIYRVEDDYFLDRVVHEPPTDVEFVWHGRLYRITVPPEASLPSLLVVDGVAEPPPGELVLVLRRKLGLWGLFRPPAPYQGCVTASPVPD